MGFQVKSSRLVQIAFTAVSNINPPSSRFERIYIILLYATHHCCFFYSGIYVYDTGNSLKPLGRRNFHHICTRLRRRHCHRQKSPQQQRALRHAVCHHSITKHTGSLMSPPKISNTQQAALRKVLSSPDSPDTMRPCQSRVFNHIQLMSFYTLSSCHRVGSV